MTATVERVQDLRVYQCLYELALELEKATRSFPYDFKWLRSQVLRSSESTCANLTEGFYSQYSTEYLQSLYRVRKEARETMMHLNYVSDVGLVEAETVSGFNGRYENIMPQLNNLIGGIARKIETHGRGRGYIREDSPEFSLSHEPLTTNP